MPSAAASALIIVGSWSNFITTLRFNVSPPSLKLVTQSPSLAWPSWLEPSPLNSSIIYGTSETENGFLVSYVLNSVSGVVTPVANISSQGGDPAHIGVLPGGKELEVGNYLTGGALNVRLENDLLHFKNPTLVSFPGSGPKPNQLNSHPHQCVPYQKELLISDLGADMVWRLTRSTNSTGWKIAGSVPQPVGSGPRHIIAQPGVLYTLHENDSTLTQHTLPDLASGIPPKLVASYSIMPPGANASLLTGGELLYSPPSFQFPQPLLYASNRGDDNPAGDAIAIFTTFPKLKLLKLVRTGLKHLRGVSLGGPNGEYLLAAGLNGGGVKVFARVDGGVGLKELAHLDDPLIQQPTVLVWH